MCRIYGASSKAQVRRRHHRNLPDHSGEVCLIGAGFKTQDAGLAPHAAFPVKPVWGKPLTYGYALQELRSPPNRSISTKGCNGEDSKPKCS